MMSDYIKKSEAGLLREKERKINIEIKLKMDNFWEISEINCLEGKTD